MKRPPITGRPFIIHPAIIRPKADASFVE